MNIKQQFSEFLNTHLSSVNNLAALHRLDFGFAQVTQCLKTIYQAHGFNEEGFFPAFRVKINNDNTLEILNLTLNSEVVKLLINQNYIMDRYDKTLIKLGSKIKTEKFTKTIPVEVVFDQHPVTVNYEIVTYKLISQEPLKGKILSSLINEKAKLLTYELTKQFYVQSNLPPTKFDIGGNVIMKIYQDLYYTWLNQIAKAHLSDKSKAA